MFNIKQNEQQINHVTKTSYSVKEVMNQKFIRSRILIYRHEKHNEIKYDIKYSANITL